MNSLTATLAHLTAGERNLILLAGILPKPGVGVRVEGLPLQELLGEILLMIEVSGREVDKPQTGGVKVSNRTHTKRTGEGNDV